MQIPICFNLKQNSTRPYLGWLVDNWRSNANWRVTNLNHTMFKTREWPMTTFHSIQIPRNTRKGNKITVIDCRGRCMYKPISVPGPAWRAGGPRWGPSPSYGPRRARWRCAAPDRTSWSGSWKRSARTPCRTRAPPSAAPRWSDVWEWHGSVRIHAKLSKVVGLKGRHKI